MEGGPDFCPCGASSVGPTSLRFPHLPQEPTPVGVHSRSHPHQPHQKGFLQFSCSALEKGRTDRDPRGLAQTSWPVAGPCTQHFPWANTLPFPNIRQGPWKACRSSEALSQTNPLLRTILPPIHSGRSARVGILENKAQMKRCTQDLGFRFHSLLPG